MLQEAIALHRNGQLAKAAALYQAILEQNPSDAEALHLLGMIAFQSGNAAASIALIERAIALSPNNAAFFSNRGVALKELERFDEALASFNQALVLAPYYADAFYNRGNALIALKRFEEALESYDQTLAIDPHHADALFYRGFALHALKRPEDALASYDRALTIDPGYAEALGKRGTVLKELRRFGEALDSFDRALAITPADADILNNRGAVLDDLKRFHEALASLDRALSIAPDHAVTLNNRGAVLQKLKRLDEALADFDRALTIKPGYAEALNNRAGILRVQGRIGEAIASIRQALVIKPDYADAHTHLIFALNFDSDATAAGKQFERAAWDKQHAQRFGADIRAHNNAPDPYRRLRIGYVSGHFRRQAAAYSFGGVLIHHDPERFDIVCYSDTTDEDDVTALLRKRADQWHDTIALSDDRLADSIRRDKIDILVDLVGHMAGHRLGVFARKPAPVQITAWGEPTGTGLKAMDYLLADPILVSVSEKELLSEQVVNLPNFLGYWTPDLLPPPGPLPMEAQGFVTFGSFNRIDKIGDRALCCWAAILRKLPTARLILKDEALTDAGQRARLEAAFLSEGVAAARLTLLGGSDRTSHFAAYQKIDIGLDPFPHSGGMTTLDALWMGIPVVTWAGETISSRLAAASLSALGLTDFVAMAPETYADLAVAKAADAGALSDLRSTLRTRMAASEFGDPIRYCRAVETAYREIWQLWCSR